MNDKMGIPKASNQLYLFSQEIQIGYISQIFLNFPTLNIKLMDCHVVF
jgi:hypothetical protein